MPTILKLHFIYSLNPISTCSFSNSAFMTILKGIRVLKRRTGSLQMYVKVVWESLPLLGYTPFFISLPNTQLIVTEMTDFKIGNMLINFFRFEWTLDEVDWKAIFLLWKLITGGHWYQILIKLLVTRYDLLFCIS